MATVWVKSDHRRRRQRHEWSLLEKAAGELCVAGAMTTQRTLKLKLHSSAQTQTRLRHDGGRFPKMRLSPLDHPRQVVAAPYCCCCALLGTLLQDLLFSSGDLLSVFQKMPPRHCPGHLLLQLSVTQQRRAATTLAQLAEANRLGPLNRLQATAPAQRNRPQPASLAQWRAPPRVEELRLLLQQQRRRWTADRLALLAPEPAEA